jgi:hypothetical protein
MKLKASMSALIGWNEAAGLDCAVVCTLEKHVVVFISVKLMMNDVRS